ncbi:MAG TPA: hypothetical protein VF989_13870 [Polyangiaceae bacterium]
MNRCQDLLGFFMGLTAPGCLATGLPVVDLDGAELFRKPPRLRRKAPASIRRSRRP